MKYLFGLTAMAAVVGLTTGVSLASSHMSYEVTVTNNMEDELLAPVLVAPVSEDGKIFVERYVSPEAEHQVLTGDPGMLAAAIGDEAAVAHGMDGPPGVLLAPGKSITFEVASHAEEVRVLAMVAPTMSEDHYVTAVVQLNGETMSVGLDRFDIGYDEGRKTIEPVADRGRDRASQRKAGFQREAGLLNTCCVPAGRATDRPASHVRGNVIAIFESRCRGGQEKGMAREHNYSATVTWTGNSGQGTTGYKAYTRDYDIACRRQADDPRDRRTPAYRGDASRHNPEDLLVAALSACHMLWYLHLCSAAGVVVTAYEDSADGVMQDPSPRRRRRVHTGHAEAPRDHPARERCRDRPRACTSRPTLTASSPARSTFRWITRRRS